MNKIEKQIILDYLKLMLENKHHLDFSLCALTAHVYYTYNEINEEDRELVEHYIENNKPLKVRIFGTIAGCWYKQGNRKPRIKWLNKHIKKLEEEIKKL